MPEVPIPSFQAVSAQNDEHQPRIPSGIKKANTKYERLVKRNDGVNAVLIRDSVDTNVLETLMDWVFNVD